MVLTIFFWALIICAGSGIAFAVALKIKDYLLCRKIRKLNKQLEESNARIRAASEFSSTDDGFHTILGSIIAKQAQEYLTEYGKSI